MLKQIEDYVKSLAGNTEPAHKYDHFDRSRKWGLMIAEQENYPDLESVEIACLMHDIGLVEGRKDHGARGAEMAEKFLQSIGMHEGRISEICHAIRYHDSNRKGESTKLLDIVRDADIMELLGPIGIMRAGAGGYYLPVSDDSGKGQYANHSAKDFDELFDVGKVKWESLLDILNFQNSCYENLKTDAAKKIAKKWVDYSKRFLKELHEQLEQ